jgi:hypothetical protein
VSAFILTVILGVVAIAGFGLGYAIGALIDTWWRSR